MMVKTTVLNALTQCDKGTWEWNNKARLVSVMWQCLHST